MFRADQGEPRELDDQPEPLLALLHVPADVGVARVEPVARAAPERDRHPLACLVLDDLVDGVPGGLASPEIVLGLKNRIETRLVLVAPDGGGQHFLARRSDRFLFFHEGNGSKIVPGCS